MIEIKEGENIYTTPSPDFKEGEYVCVNCGYRGKKRNVLDHTCSIQIQENEEEL